MPNHHPPGADQEYWERRVTLRINSDLHEALMEVARARGRSMNRLAGDILHQYLAAQAESDVLLSLERTGERHERNVASLRRTAVDPDARARDWPGW